MEQNLNLIYNIEYENNEDSIKATQLLGNYAVTLSNTGYYAKSIPYLNQTKKQIEKDFKLKSMNFWEDSLYEELAFVSAITYYYLINYKIAKQEFQSLLKQFPENDRYINWYKACIANKLIKTEWIFAGFATISLIFSLILKPEDGIIDSLAFYFLVISFVGGISTSFLRRYYIHK
ncbi:MAG: hypothetical protein HXX18_11180 [Bacteroidetes bacterium]|nr:hypothetical protein [Bacteroidota bacterium]